MHQLKLLAIVAPICVLIDLVWIGVVMKGFYDQELGDLARRHAGSLAPRWGAALLVWLLIPTAIVLFVRPLAGAGDPLWQGLVWGALFGLAMYGVYDLTNLATLEKWTLRMTLVDMAWGSTLCAVTSALMQFVDGWLSK